MAVQSVAYPVAALCIVHNVCELKSDVFFFQEWLEVCNNINQPESIPLPNQAADRQCELDASNNRDTLAQYF